jgi:chromate transporter
MILLRLYYEFLKVGLFVFGGGLATVPFLQEMSEKTGWFTLQQLIDMIAVSESTPGPIGVNMATYVGYTIAGIPGGAIATLGLITPSIIIAMIIAGFLNKFRQSKLVDSAFYGLRPASCGLIAAAGFSVARLSLIHTELWKQTGAFSDLLDIKAIIFAAALFFLTNKFKAHPIVFIAASAAIGVIFKF